ncbi:hypothetical protein KGQ20_10015 [Catenulispora sp. NF23]|uniref:Extradiol ring-cleavage dioxygenase LigAB LigA subunit domain-containing protein n=1 Tax=Catenulispora pinistramenti TaxID=2705254 RepID=A0ABS5KR77_9ACTN|nr:hypothetical protein [Catenulispora pinistramenti]MBS2533112.1 hypothetical protein [Catenulispora pinistramenti]MBS2548561.1 hypothetical protein [Catenulispora pinistramenti]
MPSLPGHADITRLTGAYPLNWLCYRASQDEQLRTGLHTNPAATLRSLPAPLPPLSDADQRLLLDGDVPALLDAGVHPLLLVRLATFRLFGLDPDVYSHRMGAGHEHNP